MSDVSTSLREHLRLAPAGHVEHQRGHRQEYDGFVRDTIEYQDLEGDPIPAFLFMPTGEEPVGGVVLFHQHNGEFHLGKSEVSGDVGDPLQAFGPALAERGVAVLAPDAITFEDRRASVGGTEPDDGDWLQHYNAMAYRLVNGDVLMRKCLDDAQRALSVLLDQPRIDPKRVGVGGHSYGGTTALYHAALDARIQFACVSGALCSLKTRQREGTGINMFEVVPGIAEMLEVEHLTQAIAPRPLFVVSATDDLYSADADRVVEEAAADTVVHMRVDGEHALDPARFDAIVEWLVERASVGSR